MNVHEYQAKELFRAFGVADAADFPPQVCIGAVRFIPPGEDRRRSGAGGVLPLGLAGQAIGLPRHLGVQPADMPLRIWSIVSDG